MNLSEISIRRPVFAWMLMAFLIVFGALSYTRMSVSQMPDVDIPTVTIFASYPGAAAEVMSVEVAEIIEGAISGIQGVTKIRSTSQTSVASIVVQFDINKNIDVAVEEIQNALTGRAIRDLPRDLEPISVEKNNADGEPLLFVAVESENLSKKELMALVRDRVVDSFASISGVGQVNVFGYQEPNARIWLNLRLLSENELTAMDVVDALQNGHIELPSGELENPKTTTPLRTMGEFSSVEQLAEALIYRRGGQLNHRPIKLGSVATIEDGLENPVRAFWSNKKPAVAMAVLKQSGSNAVDVSHAIRERVNLLNLTLPKGTQAKVRSDSSRFIEESVDELNFSLIIAGLLTALVCLLFLASWTATFNVVLAIPTSIIGAFIAMAAFGFTLNFFTMLALILAIGIVVDDSIMVLENIVRYRELGEGRVAAAIKGAREITLAAAAATLAVVAIYLPVAFMQGIIGRYLFQFGVTLSFAVLLSLLEALTLTPMRCAQFLKVNDAKQKGVFGRIVENSFAFLARAYQMSVVFVLRFRFVVIVLGIAVFALSLQLLPIIKQEFIPPQDQSRVVIRFDAARDASLEATVAKFHELEALFDNREEVASFIGGVGQTGNPATGFFVIDLKSRNERPVNPNTAKPYSQQELIPIYRELTKAIKDINTRVIDSSTNLAGLGRGSPVEFSVQGPQYSELLKYSQEIIRQMKESSVLVDVDTNEKDGPTEIHIKPNRENAKLYNVPVAEIARTMQATMSGLVVGQITVGSKRNDIKVQVPSEHRLSVDTLKGMKIRNTQGELVPLIKLVDLNQEVSPYSITREDRSRAISISANLGVGYAQADGINKVNEISAKVLPSNYRVVFSGNADVFQSSFKELILVLLLGIIISYMVLASQFNSFVHPFTVLIALPFSASGALAALYLTGQTLNIYSMIALLLLMGIVKKNSILLVDFTNRKRLEGLNVNDALQEACPIRLRPILMTSLATIAAAMPPALAAGPGAESRIPMAVAVIGGILVSTILTLFVVPSVYSVLSHLERKTYSSDSL